MENGRIKSTTHEKKVKSRLSMFRKQDSAGNHSGDENSQVLNK